MTEPKQELDPPVWRAAKKKERRCTYRECMAERAGLCDGCTMHSVPDFASLDPQDESPITERFNAAHGLARECIQESNWNAKEAAEMEWFLDTAVEPRGCTCHYQPAAAEPAQPESGEAEGD